MCDNLKRRTSPITVRLQTLTGCTLLLIFLCLVPQPVPATNNDTFNQLVFNRYAVCKPFRMPLLCDRKIRYTYNDATGNCISLHTNDCSSTTMGKYFVTFEECRRERMQILRY